MKIAALILLILTVPAAAAMTDYKCDVRELNGAQTNVTLMICEVDSDDADPFVTEVLGTDVTMQLNGLNNIRVADMVNVHALVKARYQAAIAAMRAARTARLVLELKKRQASPTINITDLN